MKSILKIELCVTIKCGYYLRQKIDRTTKNNLTQPTKKYYFTAKIILKYYSREYSKLGHFNIFLIWIMVVHNILN